MLTEGVTGEWAFCSCSESSSESVSATTQVVRHKKVVAVTPAPRVQKNSRSRISKMLRRPVPFKNRGCLPLGFLLVQIDSGFIHCLNVLAGLNQAIIRRYYDLHGEI